MSAKAAGEQAVSVGNLENIVAVATSCGKRSGHHFRPDAQVFACITSHNGFSGGTGRSVQTDDFRHRCRKQSEGILVTEVGFGGEGQFDDVVDGFDVVRGNAKFLHLSPIEG